MLSAEKDEPAIVEALLDAKADPNITDKVWSSVSTNHLCALLIEFVFGGRGQGCSPSPLTVDLSPFANLLSLYLLLGCPLLKFATISEILK